METKAEVWIPLTHGKVAVIDFDDFEKVRGIKWRARKSGSTFYAVANGKKINGKQPFLRMHKVIMSAQPGQQVDHRDRDGLNNRRSTNLRVASNAQNAQNRKKQSGSSQFKGVSWHKKKARWHSGITHSRKHFYLGSFKVEVEAAKAYDTAAIKYFGEFALLNFPDQKNQCQSSINAGGAA